MRQFGTKKAAAEESSFLFFDEQIRYSPSFGELDLLDFLETASAVDEESPSAMVVMKGVLRSAVHPDDFDRFWATAKRERQGVMDLMPILHGAVEAVADRPTSPQSGSSSGLRSIEPKSTDASSSRVIRRYEEQGRPDLALVVQRKAQAS